MERNQDESCDCNQRVTRTPGFHLKTPEKQVSSFMKNENKITTAVWAQTMLEEKKIK